jgi:hypothetical protein
MKQKIRDYGYMHMDKWEVLLSITAKAMLAAEVRGSGGVQGGGAWHLTRGEGNNGGGGGDGPVGWCCLADKVLGEAEVRAAFGVRGDWGGMTQMHGRGRGSHSQVGDLA